MAKKKRNTSTNWEREINIIRGKVMAKAQTQADVEVLVEYITQIEVALDTADDMDTFGTEGWRHWMNLEGAE